MGRQTGSCDLATPISFLVTCAPPEILHISHHYEWIHLQLEYLTMMQVRLQITGELLIPVDHHELAWRALVSQKHFHRNRYVSVLAL